MPDSITVLVVEDEHLAHAMLEHMLEEGGFAVTIAASADEAMAKLDAAPAPYSALVTDINLGNKLSGWDVARRAREIAPEIPVVYMSGFADNEWTANGVPKSIMLTKPFAPAQLVTAVSQLLNGGVS